MVACLASSLSLVCSFVFFLFLLVADVFAIRTVYGPNTDSPSLLSEITLGPQPSNLGLLQLLDDENMRVRIREELLEKAEADRDAQLSGVRIGFKHPEGKRWMNFHNWWRSSDYLYDEMGDSSALLQLRVHILKKTRELLGVKGRLYLGDLWAFVARNGMVGKAHNHGGVLSGVYYVEAGMSNSTNGLLVWHEGMREEEPRRRGRGRGRACGGGKKQKQRKQSCGGGKAGQEKEEK
uniref:Uncharacterized protein n=1 Tax=Chromera velia CCMP2878 TaxID=1169474 RepID=A0A0G4G5X7_9ALVE|eukprot:Cvel_20286.t1-p1 / transcript=Cvel_20286.t1 / gene=Cvel_20286 / organism=Chromera_velia_CCMP2878 / gene_product=hypothetical protein / transcript_product=hypothetical protein / location=Cvel_scaffold1811:12590-14190(-) / protein_length=235 / sequence_SO=supercontig / SO=protein_coding / is_pseudo=false